jgi:hypothetical protein
VPTGPITIYHCWKGPKLHDVKGSKIVKIKVIILLIATKQQALSQHANDTTILS